MKISAIDNFLMVLLQDCCASEGLSCGLGLDDDSWQEVATRARQLGVAPVLYYRLRSHPSFVPEAVLRSLKKAYHTTALRNKMIYSTVLEPLRALPASGIPVVVLKGLHLAEIVYGNIALRPMTDADILIKKEDIPRAEEILLRLGFDPPEHSRIRGHRDSRIIFHKTGGAAIEVHWILDRPGSPFKIDHAGLWSRAWPISISGVKTLGLAPEDLLLHICWQISANKQFRKGLYPFFDIQAIINGFCETFDWEAFLLRAKQWNFRNCVYISFALAREFLKAEIPQAVIAQLQPPEASSAVIAYAREQVLAPSTLSPQFVQLISRTTLRGKLSLVKQVFFPPRDTLEKKYGLHPQTCKVYFYYPVRWLYLAAKYSVFVLRMLRRERSMSMRIDAQRRQDRLQQWLSKPNAKRNSL